ncbi:MAG TPA: hypothetical protein VFV66_15550 [Nonomuraea sp.]|nr:hypothetical protein [Nonomuraea sp.]
MRVVTYDTESVRPELPVPLAPADGVAEVVRRRLLGLHGPRFGRAQQASVGWATVTAALGLIGLLLPDPWRAPVVACAVMLALYLLVRAVALVLFERWQREFEPRWLNAQSEVLRRHAFEVIRFRVHESDGHRTYDLTRPGDVDDLLVRQRRERSSGQASRAGVEFVYREGGGESLAEVVRDLPELHFLPGRAGRSWAWIRFPEASYLRRPGERPAQRIYWALSGPAEVAVADPSSGPSSGGISGSSMASPGWAR